MTISHVPVAHDRQSESQALLQQTPSLQKPDWHSLALEQVTPFLLSLLLAMSTPASRGGLGGPSAAASTPAVSLPASVGAVASRVSTGPSAPPPSGPSFGPVGQPPWAGLAAYGQSSIA